MVGHLAEDNVLAVEPGSYNGRDEKLGAVGIGAGVSHREEERLAVCEFEVFIGELFTIDGFAASALEVRKSQLRFVQTLAESSDERRSGVRCMLKWRECLRFTHIATGKVTTLKHELWNHTVELGAGVAEALFASAEGTEVLNGLGHDIIVQVKVDAAGLFCGEKAAC